MGYSVLFFIIFLAVTLTAVIITPIGYANNIEKLKTFGILFLCTGIFGCIGCFILHKTRLFD